MRLLLLLSLLFGFAVGAEASAPLAVGDGFCTIGTANGAPLPPESAWAENGNCGDGRFSDRASRVWGRIDLSRHTLPEGQILLITEPTAFESLDLVAHYADGTVRHRHHGPEIATENWLPPALAAIPVPYHEAPLESIALAVDHPESLAIFSVAEISTAEDYAEFKWSRAILFAFLCGIILLPMLYNVVFFGILRERFLIWHSLMLAGIVAYTVSSSGLIFSLFPDLSLASRWQLNIWAFAFGVGFASVFAHDFVEPGKLSRPVRRLLMLCPAIIFIVTAMALYGSEIMRINGPVLIFGAYLPWLLVFIFAITQALCRRSRAAWFLAASWAPIIFAGFERIGRGIGLFESSATSDFLLFYALALETVVTSVGVAARFMGIRRQRDAAAAREKDLDRLAHTDGLTGLLNRRGFDRIFEDRTRRDDFTYLVLLDLDHFKDINDRYGHDIGDDVLRAVGRLLEEADDDAVAARTGGEEFALLLRGRRETPPTARLDALRKQLSEAISGAVPDIADKISASGGVAPIIPGAPFGSIYALADERLYMAKKSGRDAIVSEPHEGQRAAA